MNNPRKKPRIERKSAPSENFTAGVDDERDPNVVDIEQLIAGSGVPIPPKNQAIADANEARRRKLAELREADEPPVDMQIVRDPQTFEPHLRPIEPLGPEGGGYEEAPLLGPEVNIGDVLADPEHALADEPYMAGFAMSDEPLPLPAGGVHQQTEPAESPQPPETFPPKTTPAAGGAIDVSDHDIQSPRDRRLATSGIRYEGRIRILEAFQYTGRLDAAPDWVDRNWIGYADHDDLRGIPPGPCLRVPLPSGNAAVVRPGDYVVQQEVVLAQGMPTDVRVEVWARGDFEKNFLPVGI